MAAGLQTTLLNTVTLSEFVDIERKEFVFVQQLVKPVAQQLFITDNIESHTGNTKQYREVDGETFASLKKEGTDAKKASVGVGYNKLMTFRRFAKEIEITKEMRDDNEDTRVMGLLTGLNHFAPQRMELDLTHVLTFATSSSYTDMDGETVDTTTGDGNVLCYSAHDLAHSSSTYRNRVTNDPVFSAGAFELAQALTVTDILSDFGDKRVMMFNTIVTGADPNTKNEVKRVLKSNTDPNQNNPGVINPYNEGDIKHIVLPYLATAATGANDSTKKRWWFWASTGKGILGWQAYVAVKEAANLKTPDEDVHSDNWILGVRVRYGKVVLTGKGIIGSCPVS